MKRFFTKIVATVLAICFSSMFLKSFSQISISAGNTITENFNSMSATATATLPTNWKVSKSASLNTIGTFAAAVTATEQIGGTNISTAAANGIYNFGTGASGSGTDRAIGGISSGSASKTVSVLTNLVNNGTSLIKSFNISYNVERYRNGSNVAGFSIQMYYSTDGSTWTSAGSNFLSSFTGNADNAGAATVPIETKSIASQTLTLDIASSAILYLAWSYGVTSGTTTSNAQALGVDDISITASATLPIELISLKVKNNRLLNLISWQTAIEQNASHFNIERSNNGQTNWKSMGTVKAVGNSHSIQDYQFTDNAPLSMSYYRLRSVDFDGKETVSNVVSVLSDKNGKLQVYPSPAKDKLFIRSENTVQGTPFGEGSSFEVFDLLGRNVLRGTLTTQKELNIAELAAGTYVLKVGSDVVKFVKE